jgi:hypothetical protein
VFRTQIKAKVKAMVDAYNDLVTTTRAKLDEKAVPKATTTSDLSKGTLFGDLGLTSMFAKAGKLAVDDAELATLDHEQGGIASRLQVIYVFCRRHLLDARREQDAGMVEDVSRLLGELRDAFPRSTAARW